MEVSKVSSASSSTNDLHHADEPVRLREAYVGAASSVRGLLHATNGYLQRHAQERPYAVLGVAAGAGFVLGGGLASRLARLLLATGGRMLVLEVLTAPLDAELSDDVDVGPSDGPTNDN